MTTKMTLTPLNMLFPDVAFKEPGISIAVFDNEASVPLNPYYVPQPDVLEELLVELSLPADGALGLVGETGTGKSEMVAFLAHYLRIPLAVVQVNPSMRPEQVEGGMELRVKDGCSVSEYVEQCVVQRYRDGGLILIDEIDKFDSPVQSALHPLCDYKELYVEGIGLIKPHRFTKIVATANTVGDGGSMHYTNSVVVDAALRSRFCYLELGYPAPKLEFDILTNHYPDMHGELLKQLINVAGKIRASFENGAVGLPVSTRTLVGWCHSIKMFRAKPLKDSFGFVYANSLPEDERQAAFDTLHACMGDDVELPMPELLKKL